MDILPRIALLRFFSAFLVSTLLLACTATPPAVGHRDDPSDASPLTAQAQTLPISAHLILDGETIGLEVARSPQEQAIGLMYRSSLPDDHGMLFPFASAQPVSFWMKNVEIALDMIFLNGDAVVAIAADVPPCTREPCPTYGPDAPVDRVIELRGGRAAELGIQPGDRLNIQFVASP